MPLLEPHAAPSLDEWLPEAHAQLAFRRQSTADAAALWDAAATVRLRDAPRLHRVIRWRLGRHAPPGDTTFRDFFRTGIFIELEEGERYSVSGVAGRIWTPSGPYERFAAAADYKEYAKPGTGKVALVNGVREHPRGSEIWMEAAVWIAGRRARLLFLPAWRVVHPFSRLIATEAMAAAVRRAERPAGGYRSRS